ncbi:MAG: glycosyltransferase family 2 protein [Terriglobia bacterium]
MISICIPTKDAGEKFSRNLRAWRDQRTEEESELVIVDSGSSDATLQTAREFGARVSSIPAAEFNHGETRNLLARQARGDLLVFTVQDAWPASNSLLAGLTRPLRKEPELAGVTGKQIPRPDADFIARWETENYNRSFDRGYRKKQMRSLSKFLQGDFLDRFDCLAFENVCSALRRRVWEQFPFSRIDFAEDLDWSFRVLAAGHAVVHNPAAQVFHSHNYAPHQRLKRAFVAARALHRIFRMPPEFARLDESDVLEGIGAFLADLAEQRAQLARLPHPVHRPGLPRSARHLLRLGLSRSRIPGSKRLAQRIRGNQIRDTLRHNFAGAVRSLLKARGPLTPSQAAEAVLQLGNEQLGDGLGRYAYAKQLEGSLPDWLQEMGAALSRGV